MCDPTALLPSQHRRRSIVFQGLFQQTKQKTNKIAVVVWTWPIPLTARPSSASVLVEPRVATAPTQTQRLNHVLGVPVAHSVVSTVTAPLIGSLAHGLSGNKVLSRQVDKGKEVMELDDNDLMHPIVSGVSLTTASVTLGQEIGTAIVPSAAVDQGKDAMEIDNVKSASCVGQPAAGLILIGSPRGGGASLEAAIVTKKGY